jgi:hypothetical protein
MWIPVCTPRAIRETLYCAPSSIRTTQFNSNSSSPLGCPQGLDPLLHLSAQGLPDAPGRGKEIRGFLTVIKS